MKKKEGGRGRAISTAPAVAACWISINVKATVVLWVRVVGGGRMKRQVLGGGLLRRAALWASTLCLSEREKIFNIFFILSCLLAELLHSITLTGTGVGLCVEEQWVGFYYYPLHFCDIFISFFVKYFV